MDLINHTLKYNTMTPIKETLYDLNNKLEPIGEQAKRLFPSHPKAQDVWIKLGTGGGIIPVVESLGLYVDYDDYANQFNACAENRLTQQAAEHLAQFIKFCQQQVLDNYYKFV